jgi:hypothetical protein
LGNDAKTFSPRPRARPGIYLRVQPARAFFEVWHIKHRRGSSQVVHAALDCPERAFVERPSILLSLRVNPKFDALLDAPLEMRAQLGGDLAVDQRRQVQAVDFIGYKRRKVRPRTLDPGIMSAAVGSI